MPDNKDDQFKPKDDSGDAPDAWQKFPAVFDLLDKHQQAIPDTNFVETIERQLHKQREQRKLPEAPRTPQPTFTVNGKNGSSPPPPPTNNVPMPPKTAPARRKSSGIGWIVASVLLLGMVFLLGVGVLLITNPPEFNLGADEPPATTESLDIAALPTAADFRVEHNLFATGRSVTLDNGQSFVLEPWDGESRLTILMMGIDRRPGDTGLAYRTDTMILLSINPQTNEIGMLSIPRDLYVAVPGYSARQRVNAPMVLGESFRPGSGPGLAMSTVQYNLGIPVHEYVVFDFKAVIDIINAIGGIDISTDYSIADYQYPDMYYGYDPFFLQAGDHHLDGATALKFARTRHGASDIERAGRQQQVLLAIRERILAAELIPRLVINAPSLMASLSDNLQTSMDLQRIIELGLYLKDIPAENIRTGTIGYGYISNYETADKQQVLILNSYALPRLMTEVFGTDYAQ